jgi:hypothetical protein
MGYLSCLKTHAPVESAGVAPVVVILQTEGKIIPTADAPPAPPAGGSATSTGMNLRAVSIAISAFALVGAASAAAATPYKIKTARFHATLSGSQSSAWTINESSACGTTTGSGKQTFVYHQKHPFTLVFWAYVNHDGPPEVYLAGPKSKPIPSGIPVTGTASREGKLNYTSTSSACNGSPIAGPPMTPPQPDCGTIHYDGFFDPSWRRPQDFAALPGDPVPLDTTFALDEESPALQWLHCPFEGPLIMQRLTHVLLPEKTVFGPRKQLKLHDKVHRIDQDSRVGPGVRADTTVSWTMKLTRIH